MVLVGKKFCKIVLGFIVCFLSILESSICVAQNNHIDSLLKIISQHKQDLNEAIALNELSYESYKVGNYENELRYAKQALLLAQKLHYKKGQARALLNIGSYFDDIGDYPQALSNYFTSLKISEVTHDKQAIASTLYYIGLIYHNQENYAQALKRYRKSLQIQTELKNKTGLVKLLNTMGVLFYNKNELEKALHYYLKSLKIAEEIQDKIGIASCVQNIGIIYQKQHNFPQALNYYTKSLEIKEEIGDIEGLAYTYNSIGHLYFEKRNIQLALSYFFKSMNIAKELGNVEIQKANAEVIYDAYKQLSDKSNALNYYEIFIVLRDSILNKENTEKITRTTMQYEFDKQQTADSIKIAEERKVNTLKFKHEKKQRLFLYGGLTLVMLFAGFMFNRFRITQKQKTVIEGQKHVIEERHKEITDSINYAERIQRSFLATTEMLDQYLNECFIFFKPKDVVSGDFYWGSQLSNGNYAFATADSTGHGVPGAIMSLLNITSLEKAIEKHALPHDILNDTRKTIIERLKNDGSEDGGKDGMDASLCVYDFENMKLYIAAANNPVWIVRREQTMNNEQLSIDNCPFSMTEIKADKMPIGKHDKQDIPFTLHEVDLQKGDIIYTLTDGFADQFGGPKGKKFMSKNLRELLLVNAHLPLHQQKELLANTFSYWKKDTEQIDDVTIVGVRV